MAISMSQLNVTMSRLWLFLLGSQDDGNCLSFIFTKTEKKMKEKDYYFFFLTKVSSHAKKLLKDFQSSKEHKVKTPSSLNELSNQILLFYFLDH